MSVFCGITWRNDGTSHYEVIRNGVVVAVSLSAGIPVPQGSERYCTGYYDFSCSITGIHNPCPHAALVAKGHQCPSCRFREGFVTLHNARRLNDVSPQLRDYISQEHYLYLAAFGGGVVKIGTVARSRHPVRWYEQGALAALRIASRPDGIGIRRLEARLSRDYGIAQTVRGALKINLISASPSLDQLKADLEAVFQLTSEDPDISTSGTIWHDILPILANLRQRPGQFIILPVGSTSWSLIEEPCAVGQCLTWKGQFSNYLQNTKPLVGRNVAFTSVGKDEIPLQTALF